jgi:hypothetical protein
MNDQESEETKILKNSSNNLFQLKLELVYETTRKEPTQEIKQIKKNTELTKGMIITTDPSSTTAPYFPINLKLKSEILKKVKLLKSLFPIIVTDESERKLFDNYISSNKSASLLFKNAKFERYIFEIICLQFFDKKAFDLMITNHMVELGDEIIEDETNEFDINMIITANIKTSIDILLNKTDYLYLPSTDNTKKKANVEVIPISSLNYYIPSIVPLEINEGMASIFSSDFTDCSKLFKTINIFGMFFVYFFIQNQSQRGKKYVFDNIVKVRLTATFIDTMTLAGLDAIYNISCDERLNRITKSFMNFSVNPSVKPLAKPVKTKGGKRRPKRRTRRNNQRTNRSKRKRSKHTRSKYR